MTTPEPYPNAQNAVRYETVRVEDQDTFYREAGPSSAPMILLLHGFPTSSNMYRNLIPRLANPDNCTLLSDASWAARLSTKRTLIEIQDRTPRP
jgi:pimeloyl-ACP methyl ester carboxylesterase